MALFKNMASIRPICSWSFHPAYCYSYVTIFSSSNPKHALPDTIVEVTLFKYEKKFTTPSNMTVEPLVSMILTSHFDLCSLRFHLLLLCSITPLTHIFFTVIIFLKKPMCIYYFCNTLSMKSYSQILST